MNKIYFDKVLYENIGNKTVLCKILIDNEIILYILFFKQDWYSRIKKSNSFYLRDIILLDRRIVEEFPEENISNLKEYSMVYNLKLDIKNFITRWEDMRCNGYEENY